MSKKLSKYVLSQLHMVILLLSNSCTRIVSNSSKLAMNDCKHAISNSNKQAISNSSK